MNTILLYSNIWACGHTQDKSHFQTGERNFSDQSDINKFQLYIKVSFIFMWTNQLKRTPQRNDSVNDLFYRRRNFGIHKIPQNSVKFLGPLCYIQDRRDWQEVERMHTILYIHISLRIMLSTIIWIFPSAGCAVRKHIYGLSKYLLIVT